VCVIKIQYNSGLFITHHFKPALQKEHESDYTYSDLSSEETV